MSEVQLFGTWFSPFVKRVEMALKLKGVEYEFVEEDLTYKSPLLVHYNPVHKLVPVLVHNGKAIAESIVILEYIDEVWEGPSILPKDPYDRAMARFWAKFVEEKCIGASWKAGWSAGQEREKAKEEAEEALKILDNEILKGKKLFGADNLGLVDFVANSLAFWVPIFEQQTGLHILTKDKFPNVCKWAEEYCNHSFVKNYLPDKERIAAFFNNGLAQGKLY